MDATPTPPHDTEHPATGCETADAIDTLALVRRIRDDFAARTAGLSADELIALIRREAAMLEPALGETDIGRAAA